MVVFLAVAIVQSTVGPAVGILGVVPDAVLLLVISGSMVRGSREAAVWGLIGGLSLDLLSAAPLGTHALALCIVGGLAGLVSQVPLSGRAVVPLLTVAFATVLYDVLVGVILRLAGWPLSWPIAFTHVIAPSVLTNLVLVPVVFWPVSRLAGRSSVALVPTA